MSESSKPTNAYHAFGSSASPLCDARAREALRLEQEHLWQAEPADFIAAHNAAVEAEGLPLDAWRMF